MALRRAPAAACSPWSGTDALRSQPGHERISAMTKTGESMNGAESLVRTLVDGGVDVCFANPGTSEMHFVAALDRVDGMRCVLACSRASRPARPTAMRAWPTSRRRRCCISAPASPTASPTCTTPEGLDAGRQHRRRPRDLSPRLRRAADLRHRDGRQAVLRLGAHLARREDASPRTAPPRSPPRRRRPARSRR